ncbi:component of the polarisome, partial [Podila epigama]
EYESRIAALCKRLQHLESEVGDSINRPEGSRLAQVERQLAKQIEAANDHSTRLTKLQLEYNKVQNDYHAQLETVDMVNQEVKSLVMENLDMKQRRADAEEELQLAYNRIKQLEDENGDLKADLEDAHRERKRLQEDLTVAEQKAAAATKEAAEASSAAAAAQAAAAAAQAAVAASTITPPAVITPQVAKSMSTFSSNANTDLGINNNNSNSNSVNAINGQVNGINHNRDLSDDEDEDEVDRRLNRSLHENKDHDTVNGNFGNNTMNHNKNNNNNNGLSDDDDDSFHRRRSNDLKNNNDDDDWNHGRQQVRDSVLVNPNSVIHQESLDNFRNAVDDLLSAGRSDSSSSVLVGMKSVVIACKVVKEDVEDYEHDAAPGGEELEAFGELKQEMSSGLTQLMTAAKEHAANFEEDEDEFERSLRDLENSADQLEAIVMDIVNVVKRNVGGGGGKAVGGGGGGGLKKDDRDHDVLSDDERDRHHYQQQNQQQQQQSSQQQQQQQQQQQSKPKSNMNDDEPMDALDLKIYLETQTGSIVSSIQNLLTSLRSSSDHEDILDASDHITKVVDEVVRMTRMTLGSASASAAPQATELRNQGEMVLEDLENSLDLLVEMKEQLEAEPELAHSNSADAKAVKQKLASASFDIAKYTKELVSLIED